MYFKLTYSLRGMSAARPNELPAEIWLDETERYFFREWIVDDRGRERPQLCCDLIRFVEPPERAKETLLGLANNLLVLDSPPQIALPYRTLSDTVVDTTGRVNANYIVPFHALPSGARPWLKDITSQMHQLLRAFVKNLRWAQNTAGGHAPFGVIGSFWSIDNEIWHRLPTSHQGRLISQKGMHFSPEDLAFAAKQRRENKIEPFAHELIREAGEIASTAPRSALLIAVAALETGVKSQIVKWVPDAEPFVEKMPSPSLVALIQDVIPSLAKRKNVSVPHFPLNDEGKRYFIKWATQRNQVTHGGKEVLNAGEVEKFILFATDILYLLDACDGSEWACSNLSSEFFKAEPKPQ